MYPPKPPYDLDLVLKYSIMPDLPDKSITILIYIYHGLRQNQ